jgi:acetyl esterase
MTIDADIAAFLARLPAAQAASLDDLRSDTDRALMSMQGALQSVERIEDFAVPSEADVIIPVKAYWPAGTNNDGARPAIVFAHAGGWCLGSLEAYDNPCRALANATGCAVFSVGYRLAPEHPYPAPLEDVYRAFCWVADHATRFGIDSGRIAVGGDSAGGNLAAAVALLARDRGGPSIAHQLLLYPALDTNFETASYREFADGYYLTRETMRFCWDAYLGGLLSTPPIYATPLRADLSRLPPATIVVNEYDPLRSEAEAYARKLEENGVDATLVILKGMVHACIHMLGITPAAGVLFDTCGQEMKRRLGID